MSITVTGTVTNGVVVPNSPLPEGAKVEVIVVASASVPPKRQSMLAFLATLPAGPLFFKTPAEVNHFLKVERDSWDR
jgi:hypothetical protein